VSQILQSPHLPEVTGENPIFLRRAGSAGRQIGRGTILWISPWKRTGPQADLLNFNINKAHLWILKANS
jgi:hypothetical protein